MSAIINILVDNLLKSATLVNLKKINLKKTYYMVIKSQLKKSRGTIEKRVSLVT